MKVIRTVNGDIAPAELGITQTHEHLWCDQSLGPGRDRFPSESTMMILQDAELIVDGLRDFRQAGGRAIAEMTVMGWGRDVAVLRAISVRTGVHVIATSGFYVEECIPEFARTASIEELTEFLLQEVTSGADGTDIRPGILKSGVGRPVIEQLERRCAIAVARAQKATGLPITTHTSGSARFEIPGGNLGAQHLDLFEAEGVDPGRVIIGHNDENADIRFLLSLARRGAYIQFDVIGKIHWLLDETRVELLARLADAGYLDHLLLSTDRCRVTELKAKGGPGYDHLLRNFLPKLRQGGFDEAAIHRMLVENPARVLAIDAD
jgi:predicted metal-dependent phosphotriesterase family hydrolase